MIQLPTIRSGGIDFTIPQPARLGFASTLVLPTISEGGIDFTIPKPKGLDFASTLGLRDGKINVTLTHGW